MKKRILLVNEFSELATGYSTYGKELLTRLHALGKYDIAEFAAYCKPNDPRLANIPWRVYGNLPIGEKAEHEAYNSSVVHHFGSWRFDEVALDFQPTHVLIIRDPWMDSFVFSSPFRPYYKIIWMPTVDSAPQEEAWLNDCIDADAILTYSDYGKEVLEKEGSGLINLQGVASPGANFSELQVVPNKREHRVKMNLPCDPDANIVGTVMRNQPRKLFPDLFESFRKYLDKYNTNTYLYCHTSYPDNGWDIPRLIREHGLGNRVIFSYICRDCGVMVPQFWSDAVAFCPACRHLSLCLPNQAVSVGKDILGYIYNLFDVYVQYAVAEGFGMPVPEAAACGIPTITTNATAMEDFVKKLKSYPVNPQKTFVDPGTHAYRVYPSNDELVERINTFLSLPKEIRARMGFNSRQLCEKHYNWDDTVSKWEAAIDKLNPIPPQLGWHSPPKIHQPNLNCPNIYSQTEFANWCMVNILGEPEKVNSFYALKLSKDLSYGAKLQGAGGPYVNEHSLIGARPNWEPFSREDAVNRLMHDRQQKNFWEQRRCSQRQVPYFIQMAHQYGK